MFNFNNFFVIRKKSNKKKIKVLEKRISELNDSIRWTVRYRNKQKLIAEKKELMKQLEFYKANKRID